VDFLVRDIESQVSMLTITAPVVVSAMTSFFNSGRRKVAFGFKYLCGFLLTNRTVMVRKYYPSTFTISIKLYEG